jgi:hypothetical protein
MFRASDSDDEKKEIRRAMVLYVDEVLDVVPLDNSDTFNPPKRNVRLEMTKYQAKQLCKVISEQLERDMPGTVAVQFKGHLTI